MSLTDFLQQIANSIRSKDGTTAPIPAADFPQRILAIPPGCSSAVGSDLPSNIKTGTFTVAEDTADTVTIAHGLGAVTPIIVLIYPDNPEYVVGKIQYAILGGIDISGEKIVTSNGCSLSSKYGVSSITVDDTHIIITSSNTTYKFIAGLNYRWYIWEESS